jgi:DNA-binding XRE family transcriptional regulator
LRKEWIYLKIQDVTARGKLKQVMNERGIIQKELSKLTGINEGSLTRFDSQRSFDMRHVYVLMNFFGFTKLEELFDFDVAENELGDS